MERAYFVKMVISLTINCIRNIFYLKNNHKKIMGCLKYK